MCLNHKRVKTPIARISISHGFSLVEAIVALVVLSLVFTSVWGWFGTATNSTQRIEQALSLPQVFSQFVVHLELEPLQDTQQGIFSIGGYEVSWSALVDKQSDQQEYRRQTAWIVILFVIQAEVRLDGKLVSTFETKAVKQWPDPDYVDFTDFN
ncbi:MAG: prepilin-type N-terminal cleavage/methylation domain-containing protein [Paraglaciecola sp.]|jgi:prepilin-type N-terminal cleavage/methylation domain-containing protein